MNEENKVEELVQEINELKADSEELQELNDGSITEEETYESMVIKQAEEGNEKSYYETEQEYYED